MSRFSRKWLYIYFSFLCSHRRSALISLYIICQSCVTLYRWSIYRGGCVFPVEKANNDARGRRKMLVEREWGKNFIPMGYLRNFLPLVQKGLPVVCVCTESSWSTGKRPRNFNRSAWFTEGESLLTAPVWANAIIVNVSARITYEGNDGRKRLWTPDVYISQGETWHRFFFGQHSLVAKSNGCAVVSMSNEGETVGRDWLTISTRTSSAIWY